MAVTRRPRGRIPDYWDRARRALSRRDPVLGRLIRVHAGAVLASRGDPFATLARSIVGQQISVKAADSVWSRVVDAAGSVSPAAILAIRDRLAECGLSRRKAEYLGDLAHHFAAGSLRPRAWSRMSDEAVIAELTQLRGVGRWTAEMFLIFTLLRPDVLPLDDLGLLRAVGRHYFDGETPAREDVERISAAWAPYRTVATWFLWRSLDPVPVEY